MGKVKKYFFKWRDDRRYRFFKDCSLPYFFYDENHEYAKWLTYNAKQKNFDVEANLFEALGNIANCGLTYDFVACLPVLPTKEDLREYKILESHRHSFEEVVRVLYQSPKSFYIPEKYLYEYSKQELRYLSRLQSYLLAVGLKDKESKDIQKIHQKWRYLAYKKNLSFKERWQLFLLNHSKKIDKIAKKENLERCNNAKALIYQNYIPLYLKNPKLVKFYLSGEIDYLVLATYSFSSSPLKQRYFLVNETNAYCGVLEVSQVETVLFKDFEESRIKYTLEGFKSFSDYKKSLYNYFKKKQHYIMNFSQKILFFTIAK